MSAPNDPETLRRELRDGLRRIERLRRVVRCLTVVVYAAVLGWIAWGVVSPFWGGGFGGSEEAWKWVLGGFGAFLLLHGALLHSFTALQTRETELLRRAFRQLLPDAAYSTSGTIARELLEQSALFELFSDDETDFTTYGRLVFRGADDPVSLYDLGVTSGRLAGVAGRLPVAGWLVMIWRLLVRPIFGAPVESARHTFRGLFGMHAAPWNCRGRVILLPDRLESRIGYLAHAVQSFRSRHGARHLVLEDPAFEELFAVYADDEVEARKILTPATMRRIVRLRNAFGRELLLSFSGRMIYCAVPFAEGFLRPSRRSLDDRNWFDRLVREIELARRLLAAGTDNPNSINSI